MAGGICFLILDFWKQSYKTEMLIEIKNKDRKHTLDFMKNRVYSSYALFMDISQLSFTSMVQHVFSMQYKRKTRLRSDIFTSIG
jgi:hypothetical protein